MNPVFYQALINSDLLYEAQAAFQNATGLALRLVPCQEDATLPLRKFENRFCGLVRSNQSACEACLEVQRELQRRLTRKLAPQELCCFAGLTELALPIVVGGEHVATLLGGQVFRRRPNRRKTEHLFRQLRDWGMHRQLERLTRAYWGTPVVTGKQLNGAARLLALLATQLAESAHRQVLRAGRSDAEPVKKAKQYVNARFTDPVSLSAVAAHVHLSRNHFCKVFKESVGMTLTEYISRVRVEKAKTLLAGSRFRVHEVADRTGFNSISQFNRAFRAYTTLSPTAYRASLPA